MQPKKQWLTVKRTQATIIFFSQICSDWASDGPESFNDHVRFYTDKILIQSGCTLEPILLSSQVIDRLEKIESDVREQRSILSTIVQSTQGFEGLYDCRFRQSEPWLIEDLTMSDIWYIAVKIYTDSAFRKVLRDYLHCYRSPFNNSKAVTSDHILNSTFNIATIADQVKNASPTERNDFLKTLIVKGSPTMVAPFLNASLDPDEGEIWNNYLGNSSACGHLSVVDTLIDAGADCIRALPRFLQATDLEIPMFDALYSNSWII